MNPETRPPERAILGQLSKLKSGNTMSMRYEEFCADPSRRHDILLEKLAGLGHETDRPYSGPDRFDASVEIRVHAGEWHWLRSVYLDVLALAPHRKRFLDEGVASTLPDPDWARTCLDKFECGVRLKAAGFGVPWSSLSLEEARHALKGDQFRFPVVVKARHGYGSLGMALCREMGDLEFHYRRMTGNSGANDPIGMSREASALIQEHVSGPELCALLVNDLDGRHAAHFVTEIHEMRAGESDRATTLDPETLGDLPRRFSELTRHGGIWGIDVLLGDGGPVVVDVNPRFTGDYPFQHIAGANIPAALIAWAEGAIPDPAWLRAEVGVSGYKDLMPTRELSSLINPTPPLPAIKAGKSGEF